MDRTPAPPGLVVRLRRGDPPHVRPRVPAFAVAAVLLVVILPVVADGPGARPAAAPAIALSSAAASSFVPAAARDVAQFRFPANPADGHPGLPPVRDAARSGSLSSSRVPARARFLRRQRRGLAADVPRPLDRAGSSRTDGDRRGRRIPALGVPPRQPRRLLGPADLRHTASSNFRPRRSLREQAAERVKPGTGHAFGRASLSGEKISRGTGSTSRTPS